MCRSPTDMELQECLQISSTRLQTFRSVSQQHHVAVEDRVNDTFTDLSPQQKDSQMVCAHSGDTSICNCSFPGLKDSTSGTQLYIRLDADIICGPSSHQVPSLQRIALPTQQVLDVKKNLASILEIDKWHSSAYLVP